MRKLFLVLSLLTAGLVLLIFVSNIMTTLLERYLPAVQIRPDDMGKFVLRGQFQTAYQHASLTQAKNIELAASMINGLVVEPGEVFSFNRTVGPYTPERGFALGDTVIGDQVVQTYGGGVCQVAGTLHNAVLLAGLEVVERHHHTLSIPYMPPGQDAAVSISGGKDYKFRNNTNQPVLIWSGAKQGLLTVRIYGETRGPHITLHHQILATVPPPEIRKVDPALPRGAEQLVRQGVEGRTIRYWLEVETQQSKTVKELGTETYRPSPRIVIVGSGTAEQ
ncbi:VanW family protein [Calderihabitans maritimus]|uniref:VanW family protein n=1 Tax=Calderihabitans maritimus TaxID=1246530 RepID=A0A1Z5HR05_9FIRM|nr:VanW family protein [Calderihabitans maritimus]GAW91972.1 VanW family protein [Calderihabitans maritimus]